MTGGKPPLPPMRPRLPSAREDPRRDPEPSGQPTPEQSLRNVVIQLANADLQRIQLLAQMSKHIDVLARAATLWIAQQEAAQSLRPVSSHDLEERLAKERQTESIRIRQTFVRWLGDAMLATMKQSWRVAVGAVVLAACAAAGGFFVHDCLPRAVAPVTHAP